MTWLLKYECIICGNTWERYESKELVDYEGDYCKVCQKYSPNSFVMVITLTDAKTRLTEKVNSHKPNSPDRKEKANASA